MDNKAVLQPVYDDMVKSGEWFSVGDLKEAYNLTISQRDYLRQNLYAETTGYSTSTKKVDGIIFYKLTKPGDLSAVSIALLFKPTSCSTFTAKHGL